jgi:hypothetical protein
LLEEKGVDVELLAPRSVEEEEESLCMARMTKRIRATMITVYNASMPSEKDGQSQKTGTEGKRTNREGGR